MQRSNGEVSVVGFINFMLIVSTDFLAGFFIFNSDILPNNLGANATIQSFLNVSINGESDYLK